jgi:hypothetical protein
MADDGLRRFIGGSPIGVFIRLALLSILIGFVLTVLGLDPRDIFSSIVTLIRSIFNLGFDAIGWVWSYFLLGAAVVIPIWLIMRFVQSRKS